MLRIRLKCRPIALSISFILMAILALSGAGSAFADGGGSVSTTITGGSLSETITVPTVDNATLDGTDKNLTITMPIAVIDATGSGSGWKVTITSTTFSTGGGSPHTLTTAPVVSAVSVACVSGSTCTDPTNAITYNLTVPSGSPAPTAVKLFNAAVGTGMGKFTLTPTLTLKLLSNVYAGTYSSTFTLAISSGP